jgi:hypothetical protein
MRVKYVVSVVVTVLILVAEGVSLVRHFWLGVALSLVVDVGVIWWGVCEFARANGIQIRRVKEDKDPRDD